MKIGNLNELQEEIAIRLFWSRSELESQFEGDNLSIDQQKSILRGYFGDCEFIELFNECLNDIKNR